MSPYVKTVFPTFQYHDVKEKKNSPAEDIPCSIRGSDSTYCVRHYASGRLLSLASMESFIMLDTSLYLDESVGGCFDCTSRVINIYIYKDN